MEHPDHVATKPPEDDLSSSIGVVSMGCCQGTHALLLFPYLDIL